MKPETIVILSMIYEDFLKDKFLHRNELLDNKVDEIGTLENNKQLAVIDNQKWYRKIIDIFRK